MSTGLTWVTAYDYDTTIPDSVSWSQSFNDYEEAKSFALWNAKLTYDLTYPAARSIYYAVYTTGPNENGYTNSNAADPVFVPFD